MVRDRLLLCEDYDGELKRLTSLGESAGLTLDAHGPKTPPLPRACGGTDDGDDNDD
jgi:hypothetical protein